MKITFTGVLTKKGETVTFDTEKHMYYQGMAEDADLYIPAGKAKDVTTVAKDLEGKGFLEVSRDVFNKVSAVKDTVSRQFIELFQLITKLRMSKDDVIREAELVEEYGEWYHMSLMGYAEDELRAVADVM